MQEKLSLYDTIFRCEDNINECDSNPCLNEGTCLDKNGYFECLCMPGKSRYSSFQLYNYNLAIFLANMAMTPHIAMSGHFVCALAGPQKPDNSRHSGAVTCPAVPSSGCTEFQS